MMFNLHDFGYFESVLYNVQLVNTQPGIIDYVVISAEPISCGSISCGLPVVVTITEI